MDDDEAMGSGAIPVEQLPEAVRVMRHNLRNLQHAFGLQNELLTQASIDTQATAQRAESNTVKALDAVQSINYNLYGYPDRKDDHGVLGRIEDGIAAGAKRDWAVLLAILGLIGTLAATLVLHH